HLGGEVNVSERLGDVRIVVAVPVPGPSHAGIQTLSVRASLLEARAIDAPHVAVSGRKRAAVGKQFQPLPGKSQFRTPSSVGSGTLVQDALDVHGVAQAGVIPIEKPPALTPWMHV